jgi:hypothetical protein
MGCHAMCCFDIESKLQQPWHSEASSPINCHYGAATVAAANPALLLLLLLPSGWKVTASGSRPYAGSQKSGLMQVAMPLPLLSPAFPLAFPKLTVLLFALTSGCTQKPFL